MQHTSDTLCKAHIATGLQHANDTSYLGSDEPLRIPLPDALGYVRLRLSGPSLVLGHISHASSLQCVPPGMQWLHGTLTPSRRHAVFDVGSNSADVQTWASAGFRTRRLLRVSSLELDPVCVCL